MWQMLEKLISLFFRPEIPHNELINVVYFFLFRSAFVFTKIRKNCTGCQPLENGGLQVHRVTSQELHSSNVQKQVHFVFNFIFVWDLLTNYLSLNQDFWSSFEFTARV